CQPELLDFLSGNLARLGVDLALETCGHFPWPDNEASLARMDLVYFDLKHMDDTAHARLTGVGNAAILENAIRIARLGRPMVVRIPLIQGLNDSAENLAATARFVARDLGSRIPVEVLPYHALGRAKYQAIGQTYGLDGLSSPAPEQVAWAKAELTRGGATVVR
ncbi:MAG TPA: hypothetical protein VN436_13365, partial [Holophaga sp.]|nr:hypothetical protein [Holophaga sp.]